MRVPPTTKRKRLALLIALAAAIVLLGIAVHWHMAPSALTPALFVQTQGGIDSVEFSGDGRLLMTVYVDGSFAAATPEPGDFDACWSVSGVRPELLDPALLDFFDRGRRKRPGSAASCYRRNCRKGSAGVPSWSSSRPTGHRPPAAPPAPWRLRPGPVKVLALVHPVPTASW